MTNIKTGQTYIAQILEVLPNQGILLVKPISGQNIHKRISIPTSAGTYGASIIQCYSIGSRVLVYKNSDFAQDRLIGVVSSQSPKHVYTKLNNFGNFPWSKWFSHTSLYKTQATEIFNTSQLSDTQVNATKYNGDLYSGDIGIVDISGNSRFLFGDYQLLLGQNATQIRMTGVDNKISLTAHQLQQNTLTTYQTKSPNISKRLIAAQISQGLGVASGKVILDQWGSINNSEAFPYFRYQQLDGALVNGHQQSILLHTVYSDSAQQEDSSQPLIYRASSQFIPAYKRHIKYSGQASQFTAVATRSIKTPNIVAQTQGISINQYAEKLQSFQDSINIALYLQAYYTNGNLYSQYPVNHNIGQNAAILQQQYVGFNDKTIKLQLKFQQDQIQLNETQQYIKPQYKQYHDTNTNQTSKITDLTSIVSQQSDGSIIIKDGWGSQIRLHGGNIYISSALDTFVRPGRDLIQMVPRLRDIQSNGSITITSKDNIRIGAQNNTCVASGISGNAAMTTIQNRSQGKAYNSGVVLRSNSDMSLTSSGDMYIGLNDKTQKNSKDKVTQSESGSIIVGGGSDILLYSRNIQMLADTDLDLFGGSSRIHLNTAGITGIAPSTVLDSWLQLTTAYQTYDNQVINGHKYISKSSQSHDIITTGMTACSGAVITGNLQAQGQIIGDSFAMVKPPPQTMPQVMNISSLMQNYNNVRNFPTHHLTIPTSSRPLCYSDSFICYNQFRYPKYTDFIVQQCLPGMCWQSNIKFNLSGVLQQSAQVPTTGTKQMSIAYPGVAFSKLNISKWNNDISGIQLAKCNTAYKVTRTKYKENTDA